MWMPITMRELTEVEIQKIYKKLVRFVGTSIEEMFNMKKDLRLHNQKVLIVSKNHLKHTSQVSRNDLVCAGTVLGKFTKTNKFWINITAIHHLEKCSLHKIWIKSSAEMNFLYGNNILRSHMHKISSEVPQNSVVFVYNQNNTPLGFGITARSSSDIIASQGKAIIVMNQADTGLYLRNEAVV